jgi:hypothetical protein
MPDANKKLLPITIITVALLLLVTLLLPILRVYYVDYYVCSGEYDGGGVASATVSCTDSPLVTFSSALASSVFGFLALVAPKFILFLWLLHGWVRTYVKNKCQFAILIIAYAITSLTALYLDFTAFNSAMKPLVMSGMAVLGCIFTALILAVGGFITWRIAVFFSRPRARR